jgi:hypothetical protein
MRRRSALLVCLALLSVLAISGCLKSPNLPTSTPLLFSASSTPAASRPADPSDTPTAAQPLPSAQATFTRPADTPSSTTEPVPSATPTPTPLPTWPDRWQQTGGPVGGSMSAVAVSPADHGSLLAAGLGGAVYQSGESDIWYPGERVTVPFRVWSSMPTMRISFTPRICVQVS